jgi:hypothetical protein
VAPSRATASESTAGAVAAGAVWTGGSVAAVTVVGVYLFSEPVTFLRIGSILLILIGMVGLRLDGVGWYIANKMWLGVRLGGGFVWARHTPESIERARMYCSLTPRSAP